MQRSGCSFLLGDANIGGTTAIFPCQSHEKETSWLLKTNKMPHLMMTQRLHLLAISANVNVGGMTAIFPASTVVRC
jgi:hypothetical protein